MCIADLPAIFHDGYNARGALAVLPLQTSAYVFGVGGEALGGRHDSVEVNREALGAWCTGYAARQRFSRRYFGRSVIIAACPSGDLC